MTICVAMVWRGSEWHPRQEQCGKPAKGTRESWPVCGIHLRAKSVMITTAPGRSKAVTA